MQLMSRTLQVSSTAVPVVLGRPALEPVRLSGQEGVNSLFDYELLLKTPDGLNLDASGAADFELDAFIGREITCTIQLDGAGAFFPGAAGGSTDRLGAGTREINALITSACLWGEEGRHIQYKLTLRPWLYLATLTTDCRIFQNQTVVQMLDTLLGDYAFPVDKRLIETYPAREFSTQFNESDFAFFSRLCQEWGISYFFEHSDGKHRLVLIDNLGAFKQNESEAYREVDYHPPGWKADVEYIHSFAPVSRLTSGCYSTRDYDYSRPRADLSVTRSDPRPTARANGEVYLWHAGGAGSAGGHYAQPRAGSARVSSDAIDLHAEGRHLALLRMQALRTHGVRANASGNLRGMVPGCSFALKGHPRQQANGGYLILDTRLLIEDVAQDSQIRNAAAHRQQHWKVEVDFTAHPLTEPLRPPLTLSKPWSHGPQTAMVVGPAGQSLWTDDLGRIKVQFLWDRIGENNQHSTCWIRVSSPWAGNQLGGVHIPRIGQEVIIDFIGGDMDLPVCTGRVHNQSNLPPWRLPDQAALSGFRSREQTEEGGNSAAGRSNHLVMDDTTERIQVQLKSDHQSSSVSLGHITRIEDNAGRKDARGEGFELRSDGHGVLRAGDGLLITTEARAHAARHAKDITETMGRLTARREQHQNLSAAARQAGAHESSDQDVVVDALRTQDDSIRGTGTSTSTSTSTTRIGNGAHSRKRADFIELDAPHLVLASPAGLETTTAGSTHIASDVHTALTSGGHTSISAARSFLVSTREAIRMMALKTGVMLKAAHGDIDISALKHSVNVLAKLDITLTADQISLHARDEVLIVGGTSFTRWNRAGITHGTTGAWVEHASAPGSPGPQSVDQTFAVPPDPTLQERKRLIEEHFVLLEHEGGLRLSDQRYRIVFQGGRTIEGRTNAQGETDVVQSLVPQMASIQILRNAEEGELSRYACWVATPADDVAVSGNAMDGVAPLSHSVGGRPLHGNVDSPTSRQKLPLYTSCDPYNWGLRTSHQAPGTDATTWAFPVAWKFVQGVRALLKEINASNWNRMTWPLPKELHAKLEKQLTALTHRALGSTAFALPVKALPSLSISKDPSALPLTGIRLEGLRGSFTTIKWRIDLEAICFINLIRGGRDDAAERRAAAPHFAAERAVEELASTLYHEARHAQQDFWIAALFQQHPGDFKGLAHVAAIWKTQMPSDIYALAGSTPLPKEPCALIGIKRMAVGTYYARLRIMEVVMRGNRGNPSYAGPFDAVLPGEILRARQAAFDLLQNVGSGGASIDVDRMSDPGFGSGYRLRPWEEDGFVCADVVHNLWYTETDVVLGMGPGYCTYELRAALEAGSKKKGR